MKGLFLLALAPAFFFGILDTVFNRYASSDRSEWIIEIHPDATMSDVITDLDHQGIKVTYVRRVARNLNLHLIACNGRLDRTAIKSILFQSKSIKHVGFNTEVQLRDTRPNDLFYDSEQWNMERIGMPEVWDTTTGGVTPNGDTIVIAVVDGATQIDHVDLVDNLWTFHHEIAADGIDNDGNGYIDDVHGWNSFTEQPIISERDEHGTGVCGIVGARGNNSIGVTGVNWRVKVLPVSAEPLGGGNVTRASVLAAYDYVLTQRKLYNETDGQQGAFIVSSNSSFGVSGSEQEFAVWCEFYNLLGDEGIISVGATTNANDDIDILPDIPSTCSSNDLIIVNNSDPQDRFAQSGFSTTYVDIAAPGRGTYTMDIDNGYGILGGTSSSSPHVAGAIAILYAHPCPQLGNLMKNNRRAYMELVKAAIIDGADPLDDFSDRNLAGGRLNVAKTVRLLTLDRCDIALADGDYELLNVYPVPTRGRLTVEYQSPNQDKECMAIYDGLGQLVARYTTDPLEVGAKEFLIDDLGLPAGSYFLSFPCTERFITHQIAVQ